MAFVYPTLSAALSGAAAYYVGKNIRNRQTKTQKPDPNHLLTAQSVAQRSASPKVSETTFSIENIQNIVSSFQLNENCFLYYSNLHRCPITVHQYLDLPLITGNAERIDFFEDIKYLNPKFTVNDSFYKEIKSFNIFNFHRGHMARAGNYNSDQTKKDTTFNYANTIPQYGNLNVGIWNTFENYVHKLLKQKKCDTVQVLSGPIFYSDIPFNEGQNNRFFINKTITLRKNGIIVPPKLYKIIKCNTNGGEYGMGFVFDNSNQPGKQFNNKKLIDFKAQGDSADIAAGVQNSDIWNIQERTGLLFSFRDRMKSLYEIDRENLDKTKKQHDTVFYNQFFKNSTSVEQMHSFYSRAKEQDIQINLQSHRDDFLKKTDNWIRKLQNGNSACDKLLNYLKIYDVLKLIRKPEQIDSKLKDEINSNIPVCYKSQDPEEKKIKYSVFELVKNNDFSQFEGLNRSKN